MSHDAYERLIAATRALPSALTSLHQAGEASALTGAIDAARRGLIRPIIVCPRAKIDSVRRELDLDVSAYQLHTGALVRCDRGPGPRSDRRISHCFVLDVPSHRDREDEVDVARNAIDIVQALRFAEVRVAIISTVETTSPAEPADVLVVPDVGAGNLLAGSLTMLAHADCAGVVLGTKVPIILSSGAAPMMTGLASCAIASLVVEARREPATGAVAA
jgi:phosphate acetyltransferase